MYPIYLCPDNQQYNFITNLCEDIPCTINNCEQCKINENICTTCVKHQNLISQSILLCQYRCNIDNCVMCAQANTCLNCQTNYTFNDTQNLCILFYPNQTTPNNSNNSNNNTNQTIPSHNDYHYNQIIDEYNSLGPSVLQFQNILKHTNSLQSIRSQVDFLSPLFAFLMIIGITYTIKIV